MRLRPTEMTPVFEQLESPIGSTYPTNSQNITEIKQKQPETAVLFFLGNNSQKTG